MTITAPPASLARRLARVGAIATLAGIVTSGPLAVAVVELTHPQPLWRNAEVFVQHQHWVQSLPYAGGILLVAGLVVLVAALHAMARPRERALTSIALVFVSIYASLVVLNYVLQTTFVPSLASRYSPMDAPMLAALTMSNPRSLAWGIEMWGYAFLGLATWLVAPVFRGGRTERATSIAFALNGPLSIAGAVATVLSPGWEMTLGGLVAFGAWNVLLAVMASLVLVVTRRGAGATRRRTERLGAARAPIGSETARAA
jgi:hypothetical protein